MIRPQPTPALTELLRESGELEHLLDGGRLIFDNPPAPTPQPAPGLYIAPPDWAEEERDRQALEHTRRQQERAQIIAEELQRLAPEDEQTIPAKPRRRWRA